MSGVKDFPKRPEGAAPDSQEFMGWVDRIPNRLNINDLIAQTTVSAVDETYLFSVSSNVVKKVTLSNLSPIFSASVAIVNVSGGGTSQTGFTPFSVLISGTVTQGAINTVTPGSNSNVLTFVNVTSAPVWATSTSVTAASQAEQESGTLNSVYTSPLRQQFHPSAAKAWCYADTAGNINASYNMTSVTDLATGNIRFTIATDFSSANWAALIGVMASAHDVAAAGFTKAAGTIEGLSYNTITTLLQDPDQWEFAAFGDQ